jgi:regulator of sigma E protease
MFSWLSDLISWLPLGLPAFLVVVTLVVLVHELGHFLVARACGVGIKTFSIGFGGEIFGWNDRKGTRWKVSWLPLGGYVQFLGDASAASTPDAEAMEKMTEAEKASAFHLKPLLHRALVVVAGPAANFILAVVVFTCIYAFFGARTISTYVGAVTPNSPALEAGIRPGDKIVAIDGRPVRMFLELQAIVQNNKTRPLVLSVERDGQALNIGLTPRMIDNKDYLGSPIRTIGIGVAPADPTPENSVFVPIPFWKAPLAGAAQSWGIADLSLRYLWRMVSRRADPKQLSGPVGMAKFAKTAASHGAYDFLNLIAFISVSIGLINLFPIPLLDGGHLLYYGCEAVLGRPLKEEVQEAGFKLGLVLVLCLMIFATWNDLSNLVR